MYNTSVRQGKPITRRRVLHWVIAAAFLALLVTGLIIYTPTLSTLASGGATRLIHKIAAAMLIAAPAIYAVAKPEAARQWLRDAAVWKKLQSSDPHFVNTWQRKHKLIISLGFILFAVTGMLQWFFKGSIPSGVFNISLFVHGILFFASIVVLLYHVYFELNWWLWKRRYCRRCTLPLCSASCPVSAVAVTAGGTVERDAIKCNNCRLCLQDCQRQAHYRKTVRR